MWCEIRSSHDCSMWDVTALEAVIWRTIDRQLKLERATNEQLCQPYLTAIFGGILWTRKGKEKAYPEHIELSHIYELSYKFQGIEQNG